MRERTRGPLVALVIVLGSLALCLACVPFGDVWFDFSGTVRDERGSPIEGARLEIFVDGKVVSARSIAITDGSGRYEFFEGSCPCDFQFELRVTKPGYKAYVKRLRGRAANSLEHLDITLVTMQSE